MDYLQYQSPSELSREATFRFKPYYKWITFNIGISQLVYFDYDKVLNLIINGLPSIFYFPFFQ